jgi:hypothetical protein
MTPQEARRNIDRAVVYQSHECATPEFGVITGVSENGWVYVQYGTDTHSKATSASNLRLEGES